MKLYFGNAITTVTTLMLFALLGFIGWSVVNRSSIQYWGRRSTVLLVFGLVICCFAAARDGLDKTIQHAIDGSCAPGLFPLISVPTYHRWLCRRTVDYCCCYCYADCKDAKDARGLVLCDVEWYSAENRDDGDCADHSLKRKGGKLCQKRTLSFVRKRKTITEPSKI